MVADNFQICETEAAMRTHWSVQSKKSIKNQHSGEIVFNKIIYQTLQTGANEKRFEGKYLTKI